MGARRLSRRKINVCLGGESFVDAHARICAPRAVLGANRSTDGHSAKDGNPTASNSRGVHSDGHFALRLSDCVVVRVDVPFCTIPTLCTSVHIQC